MTLRTKVLAASAAAIFVATSTLAVAQARSTTAAKIGCAAVSGLQVYCEVRGTGLPLLGEGWYRAILAGMAETGAETAQPAQLVASQAQEMAQQMAHEMASRACLYKGLEGQWIWRVLRDM